jgi:hypothetical protein
MAMLFELFDQQLEQLKTIAERVCGALRQEGIEYRIVGGLAVFFHVEPRDPFGARLTKDVDLAVTRADLARIVAAVRSLGLEHQQVPGLDRLIDPAAPNRRGVTCCSSEREFGQEICWPLRTFPNPRRRSKDFFSLLFPIWSE